MSDRLKWLIVVVVSVVALGATAAAGMFAWQQYHARANLPSEADTTEPADWAAGDRVVFRNTASGDGYGHVASVALADPSGARAVTTAACDRVDAVDDEFMCLRTERGIVPSYTATLYSSAVEPVEEWPLTGIPSRTRISDDGELATTAFVTGHSYATIGFSTETQIRARDGESIGDLEEWTLVIDGQQVAPVDRNYWGVTFIDDTTFYATAGLTTEGRTYLVKGDIAARTLTSVAPDVECPSLSPDGTRLAFKAVTAGSTGEVSLLPESRGIDDQIEWLDDGTILYGMPRDGVPGDYDVWTLAADGSGEPEVFIEHAWSPSVVRR